MCSEALQVDLPCLYSHPYMHGHQQLGETGQSSPCVQGKAPCGTGACGRCCKVVEPTVRRSRGPGWLAITASTGLMGICTVVSLAWGRMLSERKGVLHSSGFEARLWHQTTNMQKLWAKVRPHWLDVDQTEPGPWLWDADDTAAVKGSKEATVLA